MTVRALMLAAACAGSVLSSVSLGVNITPTTTADLPISSLAVVNGFGQITNQGNAITLRSAVIATNAVAGPDTITLGAGTYALTIAGSDNTSLGGDLDVDDSLTINGVSAASTIIQMLPPASPGDYKVIGVNQDGTHNGLFFSINNVTITGGRNNFPTTGNFQETGGGIDLYMTGTGCNYSMTNCVVTGNSATGSVQSHGGGVNLDSTGSASAAGPLVGTATFTNCTITNNFSDREGGGIGLFGDKHAVTMTNCTVSGNHTNVLGANGGGIYNAHAWGGTVAINNGTVSNNTAAGVGGGICVSANALSTIAGVLITGNSSTSAAGNQSAGGGVAYIQSGAQGVTSTASLTACTITGNHADGASNGRGGGVYFASAYPATVARCTISGNSAATAGGGIAMNTSGGSGTLTLNHNRILSNTGPAPTGLFAIAPTNAENNWWATNTPAATQVSAAADFNPWLRLGVSAGAGSVAVGGSTTVTADLSRNSDSVAQAAGNLIAFTGLPVTFGATLGTISGAQPALQSSTTATATFTAGTSPGAGAATATVDGVTVSTPITVVCPSITASVSGGGPICAGSSATVSVTFTGGSPPYTATLNNSGGTQSGPSPLVFTLAPAATTTYSLAVAGAGSCPATLSGSAAITIVNIPGAPTSPSATAPVICPTGSTTLSATVPTGQTVDWFTGSCGGTPVAGGATPTVSPTATTTYFARARTLSGGCVSPACASVVVRVCRGDFNCAGGVNIQDIFDFLTAWFSGLPGADFNGVGGINIQDIFDFLSTWFAPC